AACVVVEYETSKCALRDECPELLGRRVVMQRRAGLLEPDLDVGLAGDADREPAVIALREVRALLEAALVDVEVERLVLVEDADGGDVESRDHRSRSPLLVSVWTSFRLGEPPSDALLQNCSIASHRSPPTPRSPPRAVAWPTSGRSSARPSARDCRGSSTASRR